MNQSSEQLACGNRKDGEEEIKVSWIGKNYMHTVLAKVLTGASAGRTFVPRSGGFLVMK